MRRRMMILSSPTARVALATTHAPFSIITLLFFDRRLQPQLDQP
jgi:hypothetical protein